MKTAMWRSQELITLWRMKGEQIKHWSAQGKMLWILGFLTALYFSLSDPPRSTHLVPWVTSSVMGVVGKGAVMIWPKAEKAVSKWTVKWQGDRYQPTPLALSLIHISEPTRL